MSGPTGYHEGIQEEQAGVWPPSQLSSDSDGGGWHMDDFHSPLPPDLELPLEPLVMPSQSRERPLEEEVLAIIDEEELRLLGRLDELREQRHKINQALESLRTARFSQGRCIFPTIPPELFRQIVVEIGFYRRTPPELPAYSNKARPTVLALTRVCKSLRALAEPFIYRTVRLAPFYQTERLLFTLRSRPDLCQLIKSIEFGRHGSERVLELLRHCRMCTHLSAPHLAYALHGAPLVTRLDLGREVWLGSIIEALKLPCLEELRFRLDPSDSSHALYDSIREALGQSSVKRIDVGSLCPYRHFWDMIAVFGAVDVLILTERRTYSMAPGLADRSAALTDDQIAHTRIQSLVVDSPGARTRRTSVLSDLDKCGAFGRLTSIRHLHIIWQNHDGVGLYTPVPSTSSRLPPNLVLLAFWITWSREDPLQHDGHIFDWIFEACADERASGRKISRVETCLPTDGDWTRESEALVALCSAAGVEYRNRALDLGLAPWDPPDTLDLDFERLDVEWPMNGMKLFFEANNEAASDPPMPEGQPPSDQLQEALADLEPNDTSQDGST